MTEEEMQKKYDEYEKKVKEAEEKYDNDVWKAKGAKAEASGEFSAEMTAVNVGLTGVKVSATGLSAGLYGVSQNFKIAAGKSWGCYFAPGISESKVVPSKMTLTCMAQEAAMIDNAKKVIEIMNSVSSMSNGTIKLKS